VAFLLVMIGGSMRTPAQAISTYIRAKDENRPHLMARAFADTAILDMVVRTEAISLSLRNSCSTTTMNQGRSCTFTNSAWLMRAAPPDR
jgi:hypothetical protein